MPSSSTPGLAKDEPGSNTKSKRKRASKSDPSLAANSKKAVSTDHKKKSCAPAHVLVIDNGGSRLKYGWSTDKHPRFLPNVTARLQQQWTVLVGDQLETIQNPNQLIGVTRSTERAMIVNLGNQIQVWKRLLDLMNISFPIHSATAQAFGWKARRSIDSTGAKAGDAAAKRIASHSCAVLLALPPFCPRTLLDQILHVWMVDFDFAHVGFCISSVCAAVPHTDYQTCCLVDLGWSACHVVPIYNGRPLHKAVRRLPVGARHLINMWKYYASYRQYNLMDQEWILQDVLERAAFISLRFDDNVKLAMKTPAGRRPYDREYILPDYQDTFKGEIQLPSALQNRSGKVGRDDRPTNEDESSERAVSPEMSNEDDVDKGSAGSDDDGNETCNDSEDEENDPERRRLRILNERAEEARRQQEAATDQQVLKLSVERFVIPEALFRPSDAGLPRDWAGLPAAIVQSISACPEYLHAALYRSIRLVGGLSQMKNLKQRLQRELRALTPCQFELHITLSESPEIQAWLGACKLATEVSYSAWSLSREHPQSESKKIAWKRLHVTEGGHVI